MDVLLVVMHLGFLRCWQVPCQRQHHRQHLRQRHRFYPPSSHRSQLDNLPDNHRRNLLDNLLDNHRRSLLVNHRRNLLDNLPDNHRRSLLVNLQDNLLDNRRPDPLSQHMHLRSSIRRHFQVVALQALLRLNQLPVECLQQIHLDIRSVLKALRNNQW